tara:strand:- start:143 stop:418 length:276 start_codon:yes stop_codon:yes gene_type:complete
MASDTYNKTKDISYTMWSVERLYRLKDKLKKRATWAKNIIEFADDYDRKTSSLDNDLDFCIKKSQTTKETISIDVNFVSNYPKREVETTKF